MTQISNHILEAFYHQFLHDPETRWRTLTESTSNQIMFLDPSGTILFANRPLPMFNQELTGTILYDQLPEHQAQQFYNAIEQVLKNKQSTLVSFQLTDSDSTTSFFETQFHPIIEDDNVVAIISETKNITRLIDQSQSLEHSHILLNAIFEIAPFTILALDSEGRFTLVEGQHSALSNLMGNRILGESIFEIFRDQSEIIGALEKALQGEGSQIVVDIEDRQLELLCKPILNANSDIIGVISLLQDITRLRSIQQRYRIFAQTLDLSTDMVMVTDVKGVIEYVNPAFEAGTGYHRDAVIGKDPSLLHSGKMDSGIYKSLWETVLAGETFSDVFINKRKDDSIFYEEKTITPIFDDKQTITHFVSIGRDISDRMRTQERLHYMAHHDALTKLPNRTLFMDRLRQAMARARWHNRLIGVVFMDLDSFAKINEKLGDASGDRILVQLTQRLTSGIRAGDTIARLGGDEFAILLDDIASEKDVSELAKKLLDALAPPFKLDQEEMMVTASFGVSIFPNDGDDVETLLRNADVAMYRAKDMGRNNYQFYSSEMSARAFERLTLENSLRHALQREELFLLYQPQVDLKSGQIVGVEALLRWRHPDLGTIPPTEFITLLEETGLIIPVSEWVLKTACAQLLDWHHRGFGDLMLSVNLSGRQFNNPEAINTLKENILQSGINPNRLELELTESMLMRNASKTISALNTLIHLGVQIAVDDFGTGYSSLNYLRRFPISTLKIDRSFIRDVVEDADDAAITSAIIVMAQNLNLKVVAEGVETKAQKHFLMARHCHYIQGNIFSEPVDAATIDRLLQQDPSD